MGMWVRSQDGEDIVYAEYFYYTANLEEMEAEIWIRTGFDALRIGTYETRERALEVLDEIQTVINYGSGSVYVMPDK
jgi:hypothetical protein